MADLSEAELLHLVDRAEAGTLLASEALLLRDGIRSLAAARRSLDGMQAALQRAREDAKVAAECSNCEGSGIACSWCNGTGRST